jgi:hypothetical protein
MLCLKIWVKPNSNRLVRWGIFFAYKHIFTPFVIQCETLSTGPLMPRMGHLECDLSGPIVVAEPFLQNWLVRRCISSSYKHIFRAFLIQFQCNTLSTVWFPKIDRWRNRFECRILSSLYIEKKYISLLNRNTIRLVWPFFYLWRCFVDICKNIGPS